MKRTIVLLAVFALLGGAAWMALSEDPEATVSSLPGEDRKFAVEDVDQIHKIFIADRNRNQTILVRDGKQWIYNEKYKANPNVIENLLDAIKRIQMSHKPADAAVDRMVKNLATEGIKVEIYDRNDQLLKSYYVGGSTPSERGTYVIMEGAEQPYVASIPGWEGNLRFRYNKMGEDWRDKTIFKAEVGKIDAVSIVYPKQRDKSFKLQRNNQGYEVTPYYDITPKYGRPANRGSIERFLLGFEWIAAEAFENDNPKRDSVLQTVPFCIINLQHVDGTEQSAKLFPIYAYYGDGNNLVVERYFAEVENGQDFMLVQNRLFEKVLWAYEFFFEEEPG